MPLPSPFLHINVKLTSLAFRVLYLHSPVPAKSRIQLRSADWEAEKPTSNKQQLQWRLSCPALPTSVPRPGESTGRIVRKEEGQKSCSHLTTSYRPPGLWKQSACWGKDSSPQLVPPMRKPLDSSQDKENWATFSIRDSAWHVCLGLNLGCLLAFHRNKTSTIPVLSQNLMFS